MAETSALSFSSSFLPPCISRFVDFSPSFTVYRLFPYPKSPVSGRRSAHLIRFVAKSSGSGSFFDDGSLGFFPWAEGDSEIQWVPEERVTLFTTDGLVHIGGSMIPRRVTSSDKKQGRSKTYQRFQQFQESDYMDPHQGLCLGALFNIAATNGLDMGRRLCIYGFCRSIEMLSDVVEDTVLEQGGEIVTSEKASKGSLHEKLTMTVAVPFLWGVPPASERLHLAVKSGGGIVEKKILVEEQTSPETGVFSRSIVKIYQETLYFCLSRSIVQGPLERKAMAVAATNQLLNFFKTIL